MFYILQATGKKDTQQTLKQDEALLELAAHPKK